MITIERGGLSKLTWNTQEDGLFELRLTDAAGAALPATTPFRLHFFSSAVYTKYAMNRSVSEEEYYVVSYDGVSYTNCFVDGEGRVWAKFENHPFGSGPLYATQITTTENLAYDDQALDIASVYTVGITMSRVGVTSQPTDGAIITIASPIYKGEKGVDGRDGKDGTDGYTPIKGVDYFDGEKGEQGDSTEVVQGTGSSTTAVMSQKAVTDSLAVINKAIQKVQLQTNGGSSESPILCKAGFVYTMGEVTDIHIGLATLNAHEYSQSFSVKFTSGVTATTLSLPTSAVLEDNFEIEANKYYELSFEWNEKVEKWFVASKSWEVTV